MLHDRKETFFKDQEKTLVLQLTDKATSSHAVRLRSRFPVADTCLARILP